MLRGLCVLQYVYLFLKQRTLRIKKSQLCLVVSCPAEQIFFWYWSLRFLRSPQICAAGWNFVCGAHSIKTVIILDLAVKVLNELLSTK